MMFKTPFLFATCLFVSLGSAVLAQAASSQDPLFSRMEGQWTGEGTRNYPISGRLTQVSAQVTSTVSVVNGQEQLVSNNETTETAAGATPQTYQNIYWIEAVPQQAGEYSLGTGQITTSSGLLSGTGELTIFVSDQNLGNGYQIHSETHFNSAGPLFTETVTNGSQIILKTLIQYHSVQ